MFGKHVLHFLDAFACLSLFFFFFFFLAENFEFKINFQSHMSPVHCLRTHKFHFLTTFSLKMGSTVLFTHLKIILLQCFLVFNFQLYPNGPLIINLHTNSFSTKHHPRHIFVFLVAYVMPALFTLIKINFLPLLSVVFSWDILSIIKPIKYLT